MKKEQKDAVYGTQLPVFQCENHLHGDQKVIPASQARLVAGFKALCVNQEVLSESPAPFREYITDCRHLYSGGTLCGFSVEDFIPKNAEKFYSIFCGDKELMKRRFESREAAESEVPKDGSFYMVYENASVVYYRGVSATGIPVEDGVLYEDKMDAVRALLAYLKPILTQEVKAYSES